MSNVKPTAQVPVTFTLVALSLVIFLLVFFGETTAKYGFGGTQRAAAKEVEWKGTQTPTTIQKAPVKTEQPNKKKIGDQKNNGGLTATTAPQIDAGSKDPAKMNVNPKNKVR